ELERALEEESPGPSELESALVNDTLTDAICRPPLLLDLDATLADALSRMREQRRGCVLIVHEGKLAGIFTERDALLKVAGKGIDAKGALLRDFMTADPFSLPADAGVAYALNKMVLEGYRHNPLVDDDNRPTGLVSMRDLIEYLSDFFPRDVLNLPPDPRLA